MRRAIVAGLTAVAVLAVPGAANAGDPEVRREGRCSGRSEWEMRVRDEGDVLRVRWRVDSQIAGQTWRMTLSRNGQRIAAADRVTNADGEATINCLVADAPGVDGFSGSAQNVASGETCSGSASL